MVHENTIQYLKELEKHLALPRPMRKKLVNGLRQELEESQRSLDELEPPNEMAEFLLESIPKEVQASYQGRKKWIVRSIAAVLAVLLISFIGYLLRLEQTQIERSEVTIINHGELMEGE